MLTRRGVNPKAIERCYYGSLVLLAGLGLSRSFMDDAGLVAFVMFTAGMLPTVLDLPG